MAYLYHKINRTNNNKFLGSMLTETFGGTGAGIILGAAAIGLGYGAWQYGGDISASLFGSGETLATGSSGLMTEVIPGTTGLISSGGLWSTVSSAASTVGSGILTVGKTVGGALPVIGSFLAPAVAPVAQTVAQGYIQQEIQKEQIKAQEKAQAQQIGAALQLSAESTKKIEEVIEFAKSPTGMLAVGGGLLILLLLVLKK